MDFGYIVSKNLNILSDKEKKQLKYLQKESTLSLISFINQQKKNKFINDIIKKILNNKPKELEDIIITHTEQLSNFDIDLLGLENIKLLTFSIRKSHNSESIKMDLEEFLDEFQDNNKCYRFYKKIYDLGFIFTEAMFYNFCNIGCDTKLLDLYLSNIITNIDIFRLNIDNHLIMKKIIQSNKYDKNTIDEICFHDKEDPDSIVINYLELLKNGYTFNNNYILLTVMIEAINQCYTHIFKHNEFTKYIHNKELKLLITMDDLVTLIEDYKYNETLDNMIQNVGERYPEIFADNLEDYKKYFNKTNIIFLD
jgi:hypothetical protein